MKKALSLILFFCLLLLVGCTTAPIETPKGYDYETALKYEDKIIELLNDGSVAQITDIFDFEFYRAYMIEEPDLYGDKFAEEYNLDIRVEEMLPNEENYTRIVFVDKTGKFIYEFRFLNGKRIKDDGFSKIISPNDRIISNVQEEGEPLEITFLTSRYLISNTDAKNAINEKEYNYETDGKDKYYVEEYKIYKNDTLLIEEENFIEGAIISGNYIYYSTSQVKNRHSSVVCRIEKDGTNKIIIFGEGDSRVGLHQFKIYNNKLYVNESLLALYEIDLNTFKYKEILDDCNKYDICNNSVYYMEHAAETFTIYKKDLTTQKTKKLLGDGLTKKIKCKM